MYSKIAVLLAATALASAQTPAQISELNVVMKDVKDHLSDYMSLASNPNSGVSAATLPAGVLNLALAVQTATDMSYTTLYKDVDFAAVSTFLPKLPWYSSRLQAQLEAATASLTTAEATTSNLIATTSAVAPMTSDLVATTSAVAPMTSDLVATTSAAANATSTAYSYRNTTVTICEASGCHVTTTTETICTHAQCQAKTTTAVCTKDSCQAGKNGTATISHQTTNGAIKNIAGLGAGALAAAALLL